MTQELAILTPYFNPFRSSFRYKTYEVFKKVLEEKYSCRPFTIELSFHDHFETPPGDRTFHIKGSLKENLMWQKERLLNILLEKIPSRYEYIAWCDSDIVFGNENFVDDTVNSLRSHHVVQMFDRATWLRRDGTRIHTKVGFVKHVLMNGSKGLVNATRASHIGFAWASRRALLEEHGLFDRSIAGGGDSFMAYAFMNQFAWDYINYKNAWKRSTGFRNEFETWAKGIMETVSSNVGYVEGEVFHLYHGPLGKRGAVTREIAMNQLNYNPSRDIELNENMIFQWRKNANPVLQSFIASFLENRDDLT